ncbi:signal peptidase I [Candidatus Kuenenbacteria bacterium]|nr:signal peptidase I [Candidatus Kuenenbacteria bacterium]
MGFTDKDFLDNLTPTQKVLQFFWDLLKVVCISLAIIIPVRYFLIQPFYVKGASMEPSFYDHEYLIINEINYRFSEPDRGDIIVFKYPKDPSQFFIKRIIGLPGEKIEITGGQIYIYPKGENTKFLLEESGYLDEDVKTSNSKSWKLGANEFYVMGDNRDYSLDSRSFGPVYRELIVGKVWFRGWPFWRFTLFSNVQYET